MLNLRRSISALVLAVCLLAGCASPNQDKFNVQVRKWVPLGMPVEDAKKVMEGKGFECAIEKVDNPFNPSGIERLECDKIAIWLHSWHATFYLEDDKVVKYGPISVD